MSSTSKYKLNELVNENKISQWEEILLTIEADSGQAKKILEVKDRAKGNKKNCLKIIKNLVKTRW